MAREELIRRIDNKLFQLKSMRIELGPPWVEAVASLRAVVPELAGLKARVIELEAKVEAAYDEGYGEGRLA